jgi:hypothetical protein
MAAQHTLNASPIQACRSSEVSATAVEHKKAIVNPTVIGANAFIELDSFGFYSVHRKVSLASPL